MQGDERLGSDPAVGSRQPPEPSHWLARTWGTARGRRAIVWGTVALVVVVVVALAVAVFASLSGESQSYKDGFSSGGAVLAADGSGASPEQACQKAAARPPDEGGVPSGEVTAQWITGCVAAFEGAQSDN